jgi:hypothetical protein
VTVTVEDDDGDKDTRSVEVQVLSIDEALAIDVQVGTPQEARGTEGELLGYDVTYAPTSTYACATSALDAQFSYEWNFGDGSAIERGPAPTHRFPAVGGTFVVNVTATLVNDGNYRTVALPALTIP